MRNAGARRVIIEAMFAAERFDPGVLLQILWRDILNVVIDREHRLRRIRDRGRADLLKLWNHGAGVVVRHHMARTNRNEISRAHLGARGKSVSVSRRDLLDERQAHIDNSRPSSSP
jgi:hypothetical protein